jgi:hypothetical protein
MSASQTYSKLGGSGIVLSVINNERDDRLAQKRIEASSAFFSRLSTSRRQQGVSKFCKLFKEVEQVDELAKIQAALFNDKSTTRLPGWE